MGEYAKFGEREIKIGTCENMFYLRADQVGMVQALPDNVDPVRDRLSIRFRFPWPDEDDDAPGSFKDPFKSVSLPDFAGAEDLFEHGSVQFKAEAGYLVSLPCPESFGRGDGLSVSTPDGLKISRNGFKGRVLLKQQKYLEDGRLVPVVACGGCGALVRVEDPDAISAMVAACRKRATQEARADWWNLVADRIADGAEVVS